MKWSEVLELPTPVSVKLQTWPDNMYLRIYSSSIGIKDIFMCVNGIEDKDEEIKFFYSWQDTWEICDEN
jgi:hypothetical protein